jgi:hypothetical protein
MMLEQRRQFMPAALILACALAGGLYGPPVAAAAAESAESQNVGKIARVYELVEENLATVPDPDQAIYRGMIPGCCTLSIPIPPFSIRRIFRRCGKSRPSTTAA